MKKLVVSASSVIAAIMIIFGIYVFYNVQQTKSLMNELSQTKEDLKNTQNQLGVAQSKIADQQKLASDIKKQVMDEVKQQLDQQKPSVSPQQVNDSKPAVTQPEKSQSVIAATQTEKPTAIDIGLTKDEVKAIMGTPDGISKGIFGESATWTYKGSLVDFDEKGKVEGWNNMGNNLKLKK